MTVSELDETVQRVRVQLAQRGAPAPGVLMLLGTGVGALPPGFRPSWRLPLEVVEAVPPAWSRAHLMAAENSGAVFWFLEDAPGDEASGNARDEHEAPWERGFPCWLAADAGAQVLVHASAGAALPSGADSPAPGTIALVGDHLNLSSSSPLVGLGESRLGPLFPDTTRLHHAGLRAAARERARELAVACSEVVCACTAGPGLETPAERRFYARAGADVAVQGLADPLLAAAHAGLACLALVGVIAAKDGSTIQEQVAWSEQLAPRIDALLGALAPELARVARRLAEEAG